MGLPGAFCLVGKISMGTNSCLASPKKIPLHEAQGHISEEASSVDRICFIHLFIHLFNITEQIHVENHKLFQGILRFCGIKFDSHLDRL